MFSHKAGTLVHVYWSSAVRHQAVPGAMTVWRAFLKVVEALLPEHDAKTWNLLPPHALRELELSLTIILEDAGLESIVQSSRLHPEYMTQLKSEARLHENLVRRASRALAMSRGEQEELMWSRVEIEPGTLTSWMAGQPPSVWHEVALGYNWGSNAALELGWIVDQPDCDLATALVVFLRGAPDDFMCRQSLDNFPEDQLEIFRMLDRIAKRIESGGYRTRSYGVPQYETECFTTHLSLWRRQDLWMRWALSEDLFTSLKNNPTNAPYRFHDGEVLRRVVQ